VNREEHEARKDPNSDHNAPVLHPCVLDWESSRPSCPSWWRTSSCSSG